jgi:hypothetical protein
MDRPLTPPIFLRPVTKPTRLTHTEAYHQLTSFLHVQSVSSIPSTQRTQLTRLVDALGVQTGLIDRKLHLKQVRERERARRRIEKQERRKRKEERRARRAEKELLDKEKEQREREDLEAQLEDNDDAVSSDEIRITGGGDYEQAGSSEDEGAGLPDTARDEDLPSDGQMDVDE